MDRYAVIGHPVSHSRSPRIHAAFAQALGAQLAYTAIDIAPDALAGRLATLHADGYRGLNVTVPHKQAAAQLAVQLNARAQHAGAANTLIRADRGWIGDNTDGIGLLADLRDNLHLRLAGARIALIGSGGAARGVIAPLLAAYPALLVVSNRSSTNPDVLAARFKALGPIQAAVHPQLAGQRFDLVINATSAGHAGGVPDLPTGLFSTDSLAYDLNYGPAAAPFLDWATHAGAARCSDGLGMLVEQAAESFRLWRGVRPPTAAVLAELRGG